MVPGLIAGLTKTNFVTNCTSLEIESNTATIEREIDGGKEILKCDLPLIIGGQKGLVEESDLRIPNMRVIMQARQKPFEVVNCTNSESKTKSVRFQKPAPREEVKLVSPENLDQLINMLHNEAKVL